jgi:hypothetical protein
MYAAIHHMHAQSNGSGAGSPCAPSRPTAAVNAAHAKPVGTQEATMGGGSHSSKQTSSTMADMQQSMVLRQ